MPKNTIFIEMKQKDIAFLREKILKRNKNICPILKTTIEAGKASLDHVHKLKDDPYSVNKGTIRDVIEFRANAMEGKITNAWNRLYGSDTNNHLISLPDFLRNLADYLEKPSYSENQGDNIAFFIHPTEVKKDKKVSKRNYNKIKRMYDKEVFVPKRKNQKKPVFPDYPKSKKLTKKLKELFEKYNVSPYN